MIHLIYISLLLLFHPLPNFEATLSSSNKINDKICLNGEEQRLFTIINNYRKQKGLKSVPLSSSLTKVAQTHARDLMAHYTNNKDCNPHSWSEHGAWSSCCYTNDHKQAQCMWDKPKEISGYEGAGYEIVYWHSEAATAPGALIGWKKSPSHNPIIINSGMWKDAMWNAIGIGIHQEYAVVWFGQEKDMAGKPGKCD